MTYNHAEAEALWLAQQRENDEPLQDWQREAVVRILARPAGQVPSKPAVAHPDAA